MFYTYAYLREDKTPYYIGKGTGRRAFNYHKRTLAGSFKPPSKEYILILKQFEKEEDSYKHEVYMISIFKRKCDGGILINMTLGGEGSFTILSKEERQESNTRWKEKIKEWKIKNKDKINRERRKKYAENIEEERQKQRERISKNRDSRNELNKKNYHKDIEKSREYQRKKYNENIEESRKKQRERIARNREQYNQKQRERRLKKKQQNYDV